MKIKVTKVVTDEFSSEFRTQDMIDEEEALKIVENTRKGKSMSTVIAVMEAFKHPSGRIIFYANPKTEYIFSW